MTGLGLRMYKEEDLLDSLVVDGEGYICGNVSGFNIESDRIMVKIYKYETRKIETPDKEELIKKLLLLVPKKKLSRQDPGIEDLNTWVRTVISISDNEPVTLEHLIEFTKKNTMDVPYKTNESEEKIDKGSIQWSCIDRIAFSDLGKCVLLKDVLETNEVRIAPYDGVAYKSTEFFKDRMVIDSEAKIVGSAVKFLVGNPPGLLINLESVHKEERGDVEALKNTLIPSRFKNVNDFYRKVKKDLSLENVDDNDFIIWAKKKNIQVLNKTVERREVKMEVSIGWGEIAKIGDVVILSKPVEDLIQQPKTDLMGFPNLPDIDGAEIKSKTGTPIINIGL